ncbi:MAG: cupin domain-containing protein [Deltaproteobacteria bacterium]|nr:cupin domain-containing protein [Deltaproteobacteria bacterium]
MASKGISQDKIGYVDFMEEMGHHTQQGDDAGYVDGLVAKQPAETQASLGVAQRIRSIRRQKGLSIEDVARRSGLSEEVIRQVEEESASPCLGDLIKLAKALEMRMGTLISSAPARPYTVVRADQRKIVNRYSSEQVLKFGYSYQHLAFDKGDRSMEPFFISLKPEEAEEELSSHDGEEFIFILEGQMEAHVGPEIEVLNPGDAIYYSSTVPHLVKCHGDKETKILAVIYANS